MIRYKKDTGLFMLFTSSKNGCRKSYIFY